MSGGTSTAERPGSVERRLPPTPSSVSTARDLVRELLAEAGREDLAETAVLLVSEVVTNAILHAGTPVDVRAVLDVDGLRVDVADGSRHLPSRRRYAATAGTGRGLMLLEQMVDDWGVTQRRDGKTVWFHLAAPGPFDEAVAPHSDALSARTQGETVTVHLLNMPLLLHMAWQEHAETLLREYLLLSLDDDSQAEPIQMHAEATDAIAILEEQVPQVEVTHDPDVLMADAVEPKVSQASVVIEVPVGSVRSFATLDRAIDAALDLSRNDRLMTPPTQPEIRGFRRWLCRQVVGQAEGRAPEPWSVEGESPPPARRRFEGDLTRVSEAAQALIASDDGGRILAMSRPALELLGYHDPAEIVGQRLVAIIPERFRQAHVAGLTMYLLAGRRPLIGRAVKVPALRRDGSEVPVELVVNVENVGDGHSIFVADVRLPGHQDGTSHTT